jgi:transposase
MFIRRTTIKSRKTGEPYHTFRLVASVRNGPKVSQRTLLNLGRHFDVDQDDWATLAQRIEQILDGQVGLVPLELDADLEAEAQRMAATLIHSRGDTVAVAEVADHHTVDLNTLELVRPRSIGGEHVALAAARQLGFEPMLEALGFNRPQRATALATVIARMLFPASELATHEWLQQRSGLGELIDYDFERLGLQQLYRVSDQLWTHRQALEKQLFEQERGLFDVDEVITFYDLTNTYFEGGAEANVNAKRGRSKEKRSDCPLVTLALVLDASGFIRRSEVLAGNVSEPKTLSRMIKQLSRTSTPGEITVVVDAGIATEENITWLKDQGYRYLVVSRQRHRQFNEDNAVVVKDDGPLQVRAERVVDEQTGEVRLYCHSSAREAKERAMDTVFAQRFEAALDSLAKGLHTKRTIKNYDKIVERIGRLKQKYARVARFYEITVEPDDASDNAREIRWTRITAVEQTHPGVYCLRTDQSGWDEQTLWRTYTMLTDLEAVFRSLKSELGLRPIYHHKTDRVSGHLFISVLAYHFVHTLRYQLKAHGINESWTTLRRRLSTQVRITTQLKRADGQTVHIRKSTRPEPQQSLIFDSLGLSHLPGKIVKTLI